VFYFGDPGADEFVSIVAWLRASGEPYHDEEEEDSAKEALFVHRILIWIRII
jgi:hypothetical protein